MITFEQSETGHLQIYRKKLINKDIFLKISRYDNNYVSRELMRGIRFRRYMLPYTSGSKQIIFITKIVQCLV